MDAILDRNLLLVKEHVGVLKAANEYDVFDPHTGERVLECREEKLGLLTRLLRFTDYKRNTPFEIELRRPDGATLLTVKRGIAIFLSKVEVLDGEQRRVGGFQQKLFSVGGRFDVQDAHGRTVCALKGKWTGWNFRFVDGERELAQVSKKWAGVGKELFTSADNYVLAISEQVPAGDPVRPLIVAAVLCIDMVLKE